jgi:hypothetical protein
MEQKMTLVSAWIRDTGHGQQMIVASDSRLSFGARWDCCPKIFPLQRNDSVLAFCGEDFQLLFAGYSFEQKQYKAWVFSYDKTKDAFNYTTQSFQRNKTCGTKEFLFIGDNVPEARRRLYAKLKARNKLDVGGLDMEPLEVLTEMCEAQELEKIGGPPQLVKVYAHANVLPVNVLWPRDAPKYVSHFGRPLLDYENSQFACLDLNDFSLFAPYDAYKRLERQPTAAHNRTAVK